MYVCLWTNVHLNHSSQGGAYIPVGFPHGGFDASPPSTEEEESSPSSLPEKDNVDRDEHEMDLCRSTKLDVVVDDDELPDAIDDDDDVEEEDGDLKSRLTDVFSRNSFGDGLFSPHTSYKVSNSNCVHSDEGVTSSLTPRDEHAPPNDCRQCTPKVKCVRAYSRRILFCALR